MLAGIIIFSPNPCVVRTYLARKPYRLEAGRYIMPPNIYINPTCVYTPYISPSKLRVFLLVASLLSNGTLLFFYLGQFLFYFVYFLPCFFHVFRQCCWLVFFSWCAIYVIKSFCWNLKTNFCFRQRKSVNCS